MILCSVQQQQQREREREREEERGRRERTEETGCPLSSSGMRCCSSGGGGGATVRAFGTCFASESLVRACAPRL